jgi:hypothetical protein
LPHFASEGRRFQPEEGTDGVEVLLRLADEILVPELVHTVQGLAVLAEPLVSAGPMLDQGVNPGLGLVPV